MQSQVIVGHTCVELLSVPCIPNKKLPDTWSKKKADCLFTVKDNQPTLKAHIEDLHFTTPLFTISAGSVISEKKVGLPRAIVGTNVYERKSLIFVVYPRGLNHIYRRA